MAYASGALAQDTTLQRIADALEVQSGSSEIIAPRENSSVSTNAYAIGEQFIYDGKLYKATAAIAIGDTIVTEGVGANCTESDSITEQIDDVAGVVGSTAIPSDLGTTVTGALSNIDAHNHYSTSETWTGEYASDGRKIYRKTFGGTFPNITDGSEYTFPNSVPTNADITTIRVDYSNTYFEMYYGNVHQGTRQCAFSYKNNQYISVWVSQNGVVFCSDIASYLKGGNYEITIRYCKTT